MKKCTWCGKEYSGNASNCAIDGSPLTSDPPIPAPEAGIANPASGALPVQTENELEREDQTARDGQGKEADGFISLGQYDGFEAARLLRRFEAAGIQFQIDQVESPIVTARGTRRANLIEIYVHQNDQEKASNILTEDWKV